ncbi:unnamed protein product [Amoebophrya sp. A120]|nr:unnamed protein product [Amoebophrya sp. A120]|eukprot:GSA120T00000560001.1
MSWDSNYDNDLRPEEGFVRVDGTEIWRKARLSKNVHDPDALYHCGAGGWAFARLEDLSPEFPYHGRFDAPGFDEGRPWASCYIDVDHTMAHGRPDLLIEVGATIDQEAIDESFAFSNFELFQGDSISTSPGELLFCDNEKVVVDAATHTLPGGTTTAATGGGQSATNQNLQKEINTDQTTNTASLFASPAAAQAAYASCTSRVFTPLWHYSLGEEGKSLLRWQPCESFTEEGEKLCSVGAQGQFERFLEEFPQSKVQDRAVRFTPSQKVPVEDGGGDAAAVTADTEDDEDASVAMNDSPSGGGAPAGGSEYKYVPAAEMYTLDSNQVFSIPSNSPVLTQGEMEHEWMHKVRANEDP